MTPPCEDATPGETRCPAAAPSEPPHNTTGIRSARHQLWRLMDNELPHTET